MNESILDTWKVIDGYDGSYLVNIAGQVKSISRYVTNGKYDRLKRETILKQSLDPSTGYYIVALRDKDGKKSTHKIHRLIAVHFIPNPENKSQINHKNGIKTDNRIENLEWVTPQENQNHAVDIGIKNTNKEVVVVDGRQNRLIGICKSHVRATRVTKVTTVTIRKYLKSGKQTRGGFKFFSIESWNKVKQQYNEQ